MSKLNTIGPYKQRVTQLPGSIPKDFVIETELAKAGRPGALDPADPNYDKVRLYRNALTYARAGHMPSWKIMRTTTDKGGAVFLPSDWERQTVLLMARTKGFSKIKAVQNARAMAMSSRSISAPSTASTPILKGHLAPPAPAATIRPGIDLLSEMVTLQRETLSAMQRLERLWTTTS